MLCRSLVPASFTTSRISSDSSGTVTQRNVSAAGAPSDSGYVSVELPSCSSAEGTHHRARAEPIDRRATASGQSPSIGSGPSPSTHAPPWKRAEPFNRARAEPHSTQTRMKSIGKCRRPRKLAVLVMICVGRPTCSA